MNRISSDAVLILSICLITVIINVLCVESNSSLTWLAVFCRGWLLQYPKAKAKIEKRSVFVSNLDATSSE